MSAAPDTGRTAEEMRDSICDDCGKPFDNGDQPFMLTCDECLRVEGARFAEEAANFRNPTPPPIPVRGGYYLTECGHCGWIGSSEQCLPSDEDVVCPVCCSSGCEDEPSEKDTEAHGEAVMQRIIAAEAEAAQLRSRLLEAEKGGEAMRKALKPFADVCDADHMRYVKDEQVLELSTRAEVPVSEKLRGRDFRAARLALQMPECSDA